MSWTKTLGCCVALLLVACNREQPQALQLVLVPPRLSGEIDAGLAAEGLGALLLSRLRAIPGAQVRIDPRGCAATGSTHALLVAQEDSEQSALFTLRLRDCNTARDVSETLVQPRSARREWSGDAAFWVAAQLRVPLALPNAGAALDERAMTRFLAAVAKLQRRTRPDVAAAREDLAGIVAIHPDFALGQAELAAAHLLAYEYGLAGRAEALQAADRAIAEALQRDPDLGLAHAVRGLGLMLESRYRAAAAPLARAAALDPGNAAILLWMGNALLYSGRPNAAKPWLERATAMDPALDSARISLGEAACYGDDELRCEAFLQPAHEAAMGGFVRKLLIAHRGRFAEARQALEAERADINEVWVLELKADVCAVLADDECVDATLADMRARFPKEAETRRTAQRLRSTAAATSDDARAEIDLWQIDLGLDAWMGSALTRAQLSTELDTFRKDGLRLPVLDVAEACLRAFDGDPDGARRRLDALGARGYRRDDLWRRWRCPAA